MALSPIEQTAATLVVSLENGFVPDAVVQMLRAFSPMDRVLIAAQAVGQGADGALVEQALQMSSTSPAEAIDMSVKFKALAPRAPLIDSVVKYGAIAAMLGLAWKLIQRARK